MTDGVGIVGTGTKVNRECLPSGLRAQPPVSIIVVSEKIDFSMKRRLNVLTQRPEVYDGYPLRVSIDQGTGGFYCALP